MMILNDFKYAVRLLSKRSSFTILTTIVMATGIGLSVFLFSFFHTVIFKDLPFKDGDSLIHFSGSQNGVRNNGQLNLHDFYEIRTNLKGVSEFTAYRNVVLNATGRDGARRYNGVAAESNLFQLTRTKPLMGRDFTNSDDQKGAENVVVIGYDIWQNQFGGDSQIIGQALLINDISYQIIGVMPQGYYFPSNADLWVPLREDATQLARGNGGNVYGMGHLDDGVSTPDVNRELTLIMQRIAERYPKTNTGVSAYADTLQMTNVGDGIVVVYAMQIAAVLVLLLASVNVGNLLLSRAIERGKETAIRVALGAPRLRLISQMLWESIIICTVGGFIGLLVLSWGLSLMGPVTETFFIDRPSFWWKFGVDGYTVTMVFLFVLGTILVTGLLPAWKNSGSDFNSVLRDGTRGALGKKAGRLNRILVICEIFLSVIVLMVAGVILLGAYLMTFADYGADPKNILVAEQVQLTEATYSAPEQQVQFAQSLQSRLENSSGIGNVMISSALPGELSETPAVALEGNEYTQEGEGSYPKANYIAIMPGALEKLGVELKDGRYFNNSDDGLEKRTVIVTDSFASRNFPNQSPIGKRIRIVDSKSDTSDWLTIVGVVKHTVQGPANDARGRAPSVFRPYTQAPRLQMSIAMQMKADSSVVIHTLHETLATIDPKLPTSKVETYVKMIDRFSAPLRFVATLFLLFGVATAFLAATGIYGVMSNTINQRTQEIGIKRALGAVDGRITKEFLTAGFKQLLWGGVPGLIAGGAIGFGMSKIIGIGNDHLAIITATLVAIIGGVVMTSTYVPTKRALRLEPNQALRYE